jgi:thiamine biosynthesis lipoprotein
VGIVRVASHAMGTRFEIVLSGEDLSGLRAAGEAALAEVEERDCRLSLFRRESLLTHLNARAGRGEVRVDDETFELLEACRAIHRASRGAFDPTVAPLLRAYGFHDRPAPAVLGDGAPFVGMEAVRLDASRSTVRFLRPGMSLDFGAIGKGHALDLAAERLRECGVDCALLHGGTSGVVAIGSPPGTDGWRVAIRAGGPGLPLRVNLRDRALSVSAPHGRTVEVEGRRLGHVFDPRTGVPVDAGRAAAVVAGSARLADGWSTALLVLAERPAEAPAEMTTAILPREGGWRIEGSESDRFVSAVAPLVGEAVP